jgi:ABC-type sugar transport system substrate-binding protein
MKRRAYQLLPFFCITLSLSSMESNELTTTGASQGTPLKVIFLGESSSDDVVWNYRVNVMGKAAKELGIEFSFKFAHGDYKNHAKMIEDACTNGFNAIIGPWWHALLYNDAITKAVKQGVFVYGMLGMEPRHALCQSTVTRLGWAETNWYDYGTQLAILALSHSYRYGKILWPTETSSGSYVVSALKGFKDHYTKLGFSPDIQEIEVGFDTDAAVAKISQYLLLMQPINTIVTSGAIAVNAANIAIRRLSLERTLPGPNPPIIGQVVTPTAVRGIIDGYMPAGVNLELTNSSYYALVDVFAVVKLGAKPRRTSVDFITITEDNVRTAVPPALQPPFFEFSLK